MGATILVSSLTLLFAAAVTGAPAPSTQYPSNSYINEAETIQMYWDYDETYITIELHAKTAGYVGLGISPGGKMDGADIVTGWVKDGKAYLQDRKAFEHMKPRMDDKQDVELLMGKEEDGYTVLKFRRMLDTCDESDLVFRTGTMKLIWAIGNTDPVDDSDIYYHSANRGQRNIQLLGVVQKQVQLPPNTITRDFLMSNYSVPPTDTTYHCKVFRMPEVNQKHHVVKFEPVIQQGHEGLVHHILVYACTHPTPINDTNLGRQFLCFGGSGDMPWLRDHCDHTIIAWGVGGEAFYFPEHAGFSLGMPGDPDFVLMEVHYDNPLLRPDFVDSSGIRITYTPNLRKYDASVYQVGKAVYPIHVIPPYEESFSSYGGCCKECLNKAIQESPMKQLNVFAVMLHTHLMGRAIKTWHIREGVEMTPIGEDLHYDFNYQTALKLKEEIVLKTNDEIFTECTYRSTSRKKITFAGLSTREEMCLNFIYYYPRVNQTRCTDYLDISETNELTGISSFFPNSWYVSSPPSLRLKQWPEVMYNLDWSNETIREAFQKTERNGRRYPVCQGLDGEPVPQQLFTLPEIKKYLPKTERKCADVSSTTDVSSSTDFSSSTDVSSSEQLKYSIFVVVSLVSMISYNQQ